VIIIAIISIRTILYIITKKKKLSAKLTNHDEARVNEMVTQPIL